MNTPNTIAGLVALLLATNGSVMAKPGTRAWEKHKQNVPVRVRSAEPRRINNESNWFRVNEDDVDLHLNYTGVRPDGEQLVHLEIGDKAMDMIRNADRLVVASVFLFDSIYAKDGDPMRDIVQELTDLLVAKKQATPGLHVAIILDPSHRAYGHRVSPSEKRLRDAGIDVFYSDLLEELKRASLLGIREGLGHGARWIHSIPIPGLHQVEKVIFSPARIKLPPRMDEEPITLEMVYNALLLKANHRKLLVTDVHGEGMEALVSSANPHNASVRFPNHALSVRGEPAWYMYRVLREDIAQSIRLGEHTHWHDAVDTAYVTSYLDEQLPPMPAPEATAVPENPVQIRFVSESRIADAVVERLGAVQADDEIRIQMFYLSYRPVVKALVRASRVVRRPICILLDPNMDSFNMKNDGTPNRQVAHWMRNKSRHRGALTFRWYNTRGEQNHAKSMCITNPDPRRNWLTTGSCNWTGRNMNGVNMEANLVVRGSVGLNQAFNQHFDLLWTNRDGNLYSLDYEDFADHGGYLKWTLGEKPFYYSTY